MKEWKGKDVLVVSVYDIDSLKQLSDFLTKEFAEANKKEQEEKEISDAKAEKDAEIGNFDTAGVQKVAKAMKKIARKPRVVKPKKDSKTNAGGAKSRTNKK